MSEKNCRHSPRATPAAVGLKLQALQLLAPIREKVKIAQKKIKHGPLDKLQDAHRAPLHEASNERWAMDLTNIYCGADGWGHLATLIDCHDREIVGYEFALRGRAKEAERALEQACLQRFGTLRQVEQTPVIRLDQVVQPGAATSGPRLSEPSAIQMR